MRLVPAPMRASIRRRLSAYRVKHAPHGLRDDSSFETLLRQTYDSIRRVEYVFALRNRAPSPARGNPESEDFDPIRAAILKLHSGDREEAGWLTFLSTHFGPHRRTRWQLMREVYGGLGKTRWDWARVRADPSKLSKWLAGHYTKLAGKFGNHRKYTSLKPTARAGTAATIESYVRWVQRYGSHDQLFGAFERCAANSQSDLFDVAYRDMRKQVVGFGRMGCFDFLCMLGKLGMFKIEPESMYLTGASGPLNGAQQLLRSPGSKKLSAISLEKHLQPLAAGLATIPVRFRMQVLEDAICNWQKSPSKYERFDG